MLQLQKNKFCFVLNKEKSVWNRAESVGQWDSTRLAFTHRPYDHPQGDEWKATGMGTRKGLIKRRQEGNLPFFSLLQNASGQDFTLLCTLTPHLTSRPTSAKLREAWLCLRSPTLVFKEPIHSGLTNTHSTLCLSKTFGQIFSLSLIPSDVWSLCHPKEES